MVKKMFLSLLLVLAVFSAGAQEFLDMPNVVLKQIKRWRDGIDSFFVREDADRLSRELGWLYQDLGDYLSVRKALVDGLESQNFVITNRDSLSLIVSDVTQRLNQISRRIKNINELIIAGVGKDVKGSVEKSVEIKFYLQKQSQEVITKLSRYIKYDNSIDTRRLRKEADTIYLALQAGQQMLLDIQAQLKIKFQITLLGRPLVAPSPLIGIWI